MSDHHHHHHCSLCTHTVNNSKTMGRGGWVDRSPHLSQMPPVHGICAKPMKKTMGTLLPNSIIGIQDVDTLIEVVK